MPNDLIIGQTNLNAFVLQSILTRLNELESNVNSIKTNIESFITNVQASTELTYDSQQIHFLVDDGFFKVPEIVTFLSMHTYFLTHLPVTLTGLQLKNFFSYSIFIQSILDIPNFTNTTYFIIEKNNYKVYFQIKPIIAFYITPYIWDTVTSQYIQNSNDTTTLDLNSTYTLKYVPSQ